MAAKKKVAKKTAKKKTTTKKSTTKKDVVKKKVATPVSSKVQEKAASAKPAKKVAKKESKKVSGKKTSASKKKPAARKSSTNKTLAQKAKAGKTAIDKAMKQQAESKVKFSINIAPVTARRAIAPGVLIEKVIPAAECGRKAQKKHKKLSEAEIVRIREMLIDKRDEILREMRNQVGESISRSSTLKTDPADRASDVYDGDVSYEMAKMGHIELNEISAALIKIDNGTYGECTSCGDSISASRLKAKPFASYCTICRQEQERNASNDGTGSMWSFLGDDSDDDSEDF